MANVGIQASESLLSFARKHGKMKVTNDFTSSVDGQQFKSCAFINTDGSRVLVGFSSKLRGINTSLEPQQVARQIAAMKDELQVVQLASGSYKLCNVGEDNWADVDLGL